jgi:hypothetical protein
MCRKSLITLKDIRLYNASYKALELLIHPKRERQTHTKELTGVSFVSFHQERSKDDIYLTAHEDGSWICGYD